MPASIVRESEIALRFLKSVLESKGTLRFSVNGARHPRAGVATNRDFRSDIARRSLEIRSSPGWRGL